MARSNARGRSPSDPGPCESQSALVARSRPPLWQREERRGLHRRTSLEPCDIHRTMRRFICRIEVLIGRCLLRMSQHDRDHVAVGV